MVRSGQIHLRADRVGKQTRAAASLELLQNAPVHDTPMANYAAQIADKLILPSLVSENCEFGSFFGQLNLYTISGNFGWLNSHDNIRHGIRGQFTKRNSIY